MLIPVTIYHDRNNQKAIQLYNKLISDEVEEVNISEAKMLIAIGGDGTLIRALHAVDVEDEFNVGLVGAGAVNYLAMGDNPICSTIQTLTASIFDSDYRVPNTSIEPIVNEISIASLDRRRMITFDIYIKDELICENVRGDGVIIATSVGSTAYAMSAGGPVVDIATPVNIIVMNNEYSRKSRPIIVPNDKKITIKTHNSAYVVVDGFTEYTMRDSGYVDIWPYKSINLWHSNSLIREEKIR